ncbi:MAG: hypothetical protein IPJ99_00690 [Betaproteobacteria bacterium]|nr:hypothetical protein [Betaproteobacteria bacterium]
MAALIAALALGGVAALVGWGLYANQRAADAARDFCALSPVGSAAAEAIARPTAGLRQVPTREPEGTDVPSRAGSSTPPSAISTSRRVG